MENSTPERRLKATLDDYANRAVPADHDLWPAIRRAACAEDTHRGGFAQHSCDGPMRSRSPRREWTRLRFAEEMRRPVRPIPNPP